MPQPNIVFIMADQLAAAMLHCYGGTVDSTPTLDRLAADGVRFDRCYATHPVCAPNRATILTGRSSCIHGIITNNYTLLPDNTTYAQVLQALGYRTGGFGKFHQTPMHTPVPESLTYLGFGESTVTEDPKWPWLDWVAREHPEHYEAALAMCWDWPNHPSDPRIGDRAEARRKHLQSLVDAEPWPLMHASPLPPEVHDTTYITELGLDFMQRHLAEHGDQPFFCHISYVDPHDPYDPPEPYASMFDPDAMPEPLPAEWLDGDYPDLGPGSPRVSGLPRRLRQARGDAALARALPRLAALYGRSDRAGHRVPAGKWPVGEHHPGLHHRPRRHAGRSRADHQGGQALRHRHPRAAHRGGCGNRHGPCQPADVYA